MYIRMVVIMKSLLSRKVGQLLPSKYNARHLRKTYVCKVATDTSVLFDYVDLYSKFICVHPSAHTFTIDTCVQQMIIPSIAEQYQVVKQFTSITHQLHHMHDLEGVVLKLLITHEVEPLTDLLNSLEEYNASIELIKNIVGYAQAIPMPSIDTPFSN